MEILKDFFADLKDGEPLPWLITAALALLGMIITISYFAMPTEEFVQVVLAVWIALFAGFVIAAIRSNS